MPPPSVFRGAATKGNAFVSRDEGKTRRAVHDAGRAWRQIFVE